MKKHTKLPIIIISFLVWIALLCILASIVMNGIVIGTTKDRITMIPSLLKFEGADCVLVLGAGVRPDGTPSPMLEDRLITGLMVYTTILDKEGSAKLLMSGDHGREHYDETAAMMNFALDSDIAPEDVFLDHAGFSTYDSLYRAKYVFGAKRVIIVTQKYHLYRALWIADRLGLEAVGVSADRRTYAGQSMREVREYAARTKDLVKSIAKPQSRFLGDPIDLSGDGRITHEEQ